MLYEKIPILAKAEMEVTGLTKNHLVAFGSPDIIDSDLHSCCTTQTVQERALKQDIQWYFHLVCPSQVASLI